MMNQHNGQSIGAMLGGVRAGMAGPMPDALMKGAPPRENARVCIERPAGSENLRGPSPAYWAGTIVDMAPDHVLIDVPRLGTHAFSRMDGRWENGPNLAFEDCHIEPGDFIAKVSMEAANKAPR